MKWVEFLEKVSCLPVIDTEYFLAGTTDPASFRVQISRWETAGKLIKIKRGLYLLAPVFRKIETFGPCLAGHIVKPSYISLEKALEHHELIPEAVNLWTCVTTRRSGHIESEAGRFDYRHVKNDLFWGYQTVALGKQTGHMALPEKALLDYFYLRGGAVTDARVKEMRLQNAGVINTARLRQFAERFNKPRIQQAAGVIIRHIAQPYKRRKHQ